MNINISCYRVIRKFQIRSVKVRFDFSVNSAIIFLHTLCPAINFVLIELSIGEVKSKACSGNISLNVCSARM